MEIKITGSLISQFIHCPREWRLFHHNLKTEHTSETVKIWKYYHELLFEDKHNTEIEFEWMKIDKLQWDYIEEFKKSKSEYESARMQLLFYLRKLKQKWVFKKWVLKYKENKSSEYVDLTIDAEHELLDVINKIVIVLSEIKIPQKLYNNKWGFHDKCKGCSYYEFCWI